MFPLLKSKVPANAEGVFGKLAEIAAFDYYDISIHSDEWLGLLPTDPVNAKMEAVGFGTRQYISNVGTFTIFLLMYAVGVVTYVVLYPFKNCSKVTRYISNKLANWLFWNTLIAAVMDTLLIITFVSFIKLRYNMKFDTFGDKFETWMTVGTMVAYVLVPIIGMV